MVFLTKAASDEEAMAGDAERKIDSAIISAMPPAILLSIFGTIPKVDSALDSFAPLTTKSSDKGDPILSLQLLGLAFDLIDLGML